MPTSIFYSNYFLLPLNPAILTKQKHQTLTKMKNIYLSCTILFATFLLLMPQNSQAKGLFSATVAVTPASSCGKGNDGSLQVYLTGGTYPFTFILTLPGGGTVTQAKGYFANLSTGTYSLTVTDKNNNTTTLDAIVVSQAPALVPKAAINPASGCSNVANGSIKAGANGGIAPFQYVLTLPNNSTVAQRSPFFNNLAAGTYSLAVTDTAGCMATLPSVVVANAAPITVTPAISPASDCGNGSDGAISATNTGGTAPFQYLLTKPDNSRVSQQSPVFSNLGPGAYTVTIADVSGCTGTLSGIAVTVAKPITVVPLVTKTSSCGTGNDGGIRAGRTGGVAPFRYQLTKPDNTTVTQRNVQFGNLGAGTYSLTITDTAGCTATLGGIVVTAAATPTPKYTVTPASSCGNGSDGNITVGANGGIAPFHYVLTLPDNSTLAQRLPKFGQLSTGNYSLTVIDSAGCKTTATGIAVAKAAPIAITTTITPLVCDVRLTVNATGGILPYTYALAQTYNNTPFRIQASGLYNNLDAGTINVFVTDQSGCADTAFNVAVPEGPRPHFINPRQKNPSCLTANDGTITADIKGGKAPYFLFLEDQNYLMLDYAFGNTATFYGLPVGDYHVIAHDANFCEAKSDYTLSSIPCVQVIAVPAAPASENSVAKQAGSLAVLVLPNPTKTMFVLAVTSAKNDAVEITVTDMYGRAVHQARGAANTQYSFGATFAAGMYVARVIQGHEVKVVKMIKQ